MTLPPLNPHESCTAFRPNGRLSPQPGSYCWLEIPVLDLDRAKSFYGKLFGWDFTPPSAMSLPDEGTYLIFSKKGTAAHGGLQLVKPDVLVAPKEKGHWAVRITITVESIDTTLAEAEKAGGEIVE
jgi:predicted enzyme related to lactoylglutathione lyase